MNTLKDFLEDEMDDDKIEQFTKDILQQKFDDENRQTLSQLLQKQHGVVRGGTKGNKIISLKNISWFLAIAAGLALIIGVFFFTQSPALPTHQQLATKYVRDLPIMEDQLVFRKGDSQEDETRINANTAYVDQNFATAIAYWYVLLENQTATIADRFYLGLSYLRKERSEPQRTIELLTQIQPELPTFRQEINWVLSLAYIQNDQVLEAQPILQDIVAKQEYMAASAAELLKGLNEY